MLRQIFSILWRSWMGSGHALLSTAKLTVCRRQNWPGKSPWDIANGDRRIVKLGTGQADNRLFNAWRDLPMPDKLSSNMENQSIAAAISRNPDLPREQMLGQ